MSTRSPACPASTPWPTSRRRRSSPTSSPTSIPTTTPRNGRPRSSREQVMSELRSWYPEIEPFDSGMLDVGDGHRVYWERVGTKGAKPAVFLHGGPGGATSPKQRRVFDPKLYDVILFDQRGCGKSTPHASLEANTTWHLVADIERLREMCGFDKWQVFGGSWGSTLALAYAETHPAARQRTRRARHLHADQRRTRLVLSVRRVARCSPTSGSASSAPIPEAERGDMMAAYRKRLTGTDRAKQIEAARAWSIWEGETITLLPDPETIGQVRRGRVRARLRPHREPLLRPRRLAGGGAVAARRPQAQGHSRRHRAWPLRHAVPGEIRLGAAQGLAGRRLPPDRGRRPCLLRTRHPRPADPGDRQVRGEMS